ncbi:hypothetical protein LTR10_018723 [Elasticomyces elasticus]|nr:hypothetical protein LTR10_018723 [Elasticomyces elasticus]KAK5026240.1 hypothetical protein LTS07_007765 [Exophiala sideris]KAK5032493.1 hypothetical protein LTR13_007316 [Exophiala sideris]KAK5178064.1 hypothetical protein LTR44_009370 [Eurotiomycetes sp. CCFEE 6388]
MATLSAKSVELQITPKRSSRYSVSIYSQDDEKRSFEDRAPLRHSNRVSLRSSFTSISEYKSEHARFYRPNANRTWVLTIFLLAFAVCILLLELAIAAHPDASKIHGVEKRGLDIQEIGVLWERQETALLNTAQGTSVVSTSSTTISSSSSSDEGTGQPVASSSPTVTTAPTSSAAASVTVGQPTPSAELTLTTNTSPTSNAAAASTDSLVSLTNPVVSSTAPVVSSTQPLAASSAASSNIAVAASSVRTTASSSDAPTHAEATISNTPSPVPSSSASSLSNAVASTSGSVSSSATSDSEASSSLVSQNPTSAVDNAAVTSEGSTSGSENVPSTANPITNTHYVTYSITPSQSISGVNYVAPTSRPATQNENNNTTTSTASSFTTGADTFTHADYFFAMYVPTLLGVCLQSTWVVVFSTFKIMEPFYQLARPGGAPAGMTLTADYLSQGLSFIFWKAVLNGHWVLFLAGQIQFLLGLVVVLASDAMNVKATAYCKSEVSDRQPCSPVWVVNMPVVRFIEVCLIGCLSMVLAIIILNRRRVSGIFTDPSRIATTADLLVHEPLVQDLRSLPSAANKGQIQAELEASRYAIGVFEERGIRKYGLVRLDDAMLLANSHRQRRGARYVNINTFARTLIDKIPLRFRAIPFLSDALCLASIIILSAIILAYWCVSVGDFNDWMNSGHFGPCTLLTVIAVMIQLMIKRKEQLLRVSYPYALLSKSPPKPAPETILAGIRRTPFSSVYKSFRAQDLSLASMSLAAILVDLVLVMLPGIPFTQAQTTDVYKASTWICLLMLALIFATQVRLAYKAWRGEGRTGIHAPSTLAEGLRRLCGSRFVAENARHSFSRSMKETHATADEKLGHDQELKQRLQYAGVIGEKRYRFDYMEGVDGVHRSMVEEEIYIR